MAPKSRPSSWEASSTMAVNGRKVERGTEISVRDHGGRKRRVRFIEHVIAPAGEWITVTEMEPGTGKHRSTRSFDPSRIVTVHTKKKVAPRPRKGKRS